MPQYDSRQDYYEQVEPQRVRYLRQLIKEHRPKVIIGYGKAYWPQYKELFPHHTFERNDQFEVARDQDTLVILTDHFTARTMNGKFDDIVAIIRTSSPEGSEAGHG